MTINKPELFKSLFPWCSGLSINITSHDIHVVICLFQLQTHQDFFKVSHETVKISVFADRPGFYRNVACQRHVGEFIHLICQRCDDMACISCLANLSSCKYSRCIWMSWLCHFSGALHWTDLHESTKNGHFFQLFEICVKSALVITHNYGSMQWPSWEKATITL